MNDIRFSCGDVGITAVRVLSDNFSFLVRRAGEAVAVDPGEAAPLIRALDGEGLRLRQILVTHHHGDHIGGCRALSQRYGAPVAAPDDPRIPGADVRLADSASFSSCGMEWTVLATPGHTRSHLSFYVQSAGAVFSGDALINGACGRLFEGTAEQMAASLRRIAALPDGTRVFGGHDYLEQNMRYALTVEPDNRDCRARLEAYGGLRPQDAVFALLLEEKKTNPFLRAQSASIRRSLGMAQASDVEVLAELRRRKD